MLKKLGILWIFFTLLGCQVIDQNIMARKELAKCEYKFSSLEVTKVDFSPFVYVQNSWVDLKDPLALSKLILNLGSIKLSDFKIKVNHLELEVFLTITNTSLHPVVLDEVEGNFYLDGNQLFSLQHKKMLKIESKKSVIEPITIVVPVENLDNISLGKVKEITLEGKLKLNILIGSYTLKTPFEVTLKETFVIPYDAIEEKVKSFRGDLQSIIDNASKVKTTNPINALKKLF